MTALAVFKEFPHLSHGTIRVCFTSDEEVGRGVDGIDTTRLTKHIYTMDGGYPGSLETECFDAYGVTVKIQGRGVHPGYAYGKMINAALLANHLISALPATERPENTRGRAGFFHLSNLSANNESAEIHIIVRDFENSGNLARLEYLKRVAKELESNNPGAVIELLITHQYENMRDALVIHPEVVERAVRSIEDTGLTVRREPIRGGTDGSRLTAMGYPTPNIFAGGMLFHSRREWIALSALNKAVQTILHLARYHKLPLG